MKIIGNNQTWAILITVAILLGAIGVFVCIMSAEERTIVNGFTVFGTILSLGGIVIAYLQINSVKEINEKIKEEVDNSILRKDTLLSVSDLQKAIQFVNYINDKINSKKYELAYLRMADLCEILEGIRYKKNLSQYNIDDYGSRISDLNIDTGHINNFIRNNKNVVDFGKVSKNLTSVSKTLIEIENKLKNS
jgi:hypothetical protein